MGPKGFTHFVGNFCGHIAKNLLEDFCSYNFFLAGQLQKEINKQITYILEATIVSRLQLYSIKIVCEFTYHIPKSCFPAAFAKKNSQTECIYSRSNHRITCTLNSKKNI